MVNKQHKVYSHLKRFYSWTNYYELMRLLYINLANTI